MDDRAPDAPSDRPTPAPQTSPTPSPDDRRRSRRIDLTLELAVPVRVFCDAGELRGLARNISEGGMLIELPEAPSIGARVEISFGGVRGSADAPSDVTLVGEVRHHLAWQFNRDGAAHTMRGVGVRFIDPEANTAPASSWVWRTGHTIH